MSVSETLRANVIIGYFGLWYFAKRNETKRYFAKWYFAKHRPRKTETMRDDVESRLLTSSYKKQTLHMASQYLRRSFPLLAIGFTSLCLN